MPRYGEIKYGGGWKYGVAAVARYIINAVKMLDTLLFHHKKDTILFNLISDGISFSPTTDGLAFTTIPDTIKFKELRND